MRTEILKFPLARETIQTVLMPAGAKIIAVQGQHGLCTLWALCPHPAVLPPVSRTFVCLPTGAHVEPHLQHLGTCQFHHGGTVVHVFEAL